MSAEPITDIVARRLRGDTARMRAEFERPHIGGTRCTLVDELLPADLARGIYQAFPPTSEMRFWSSFRERKYTSRALTGGNPLVHDAVFAFQTPEVLEAVAAITGLRDERHPLQHPNAGAYTRKDFSGYWPH
jgi:hypothetical protein